MNQEPTSSARRRQNDRKRRQTLRLRRIRFYALCAAAVVLIAVLVSRLASPHSEETTAEVAAPTATPKPAPNIPPASEQNDLLKLAVEADNSEQKYCYLTFDDGPTKEVTPAVLDALKQADVKATFFMLGKMIEANRDLARRAYQEGHLLANHSYSHDYKSLYATGDSFMEEINRTHALIRDVCGGEEQFKLIRFPGGSYNAGDHAAEKQVYKGVLQQNGFYYADWNCLNGDAEGGSRSAAQLLERVKNTSGPKNIVVLMHDAATKKSTAEALPSIIAYLKEQGYAFRRLDEVDYYGTDEAKKTDASMIL